MSSIYLIHLWWVHASIRCLRINPNQSIRTKEHPRVVHGQVVFVLLSADNAHTYTELDTDDLGGPFVFLRQGRRQRVTQNRPTAAAPWPPLSNSPLTLGTFRRAWWQTPSRPPPFPEVGIDTGKSVECPHRHRSKTRPSIERSRRLYFFEKPVGKDRSPSTVFVVDHNV